MTILPIASREARAFSRRARGYHLRWIFGGLGLVGILFALWASRFSGNPGEDVFIALACVAHLYCTFAGVIAAADTISSERREQTLGLLFLTDLRSKDVLIGKLVSSTAGSLFGLLAIFPFLVLPVLMGGVAWERLLLLALNLANTLFLSISLAFVASSIFKQGWATLVFGISVMLFSSVLLPVGFQWFDVDESHFVFSPTAALVTLWEWPMTEADLFWRCLGFHHVLAWLNFGFAAARMVYIWRDRPRTVSQQKRFELLNVLRFGSRRARKNLREKLLDQSPLAWLANREQISSFGLLTFLAVFGFIFLLLLFLTSDYHFDTVVFFGFAGLGLAHLALFFRICIAAAYQMAEERKSGALELLLYTPLSVAEIIRGRRRALFRQFFGAAVVILLLHFFFAIGLAFQILNGTFIGFLKSVVAFQMDDEEVVFGFMTLSAIIFALNWTVASWLGMWLGLRCKSSVAAVWITFSIILVAPWLFYAGLLFLAVVLEIHRFSLSSNNILSAFVVIAAALGLAHAGALITLARRKLQKRFRVYSADRFLAHQSIFPWRKLLRGAGLVFVCLIVLAGIAAIWRRRVNIRGAAAWESALAAHPEFLREPPPRPAAPKIPAEENLAEAPIFKQLQPGNQRVNRNSRTNLNNLLNLGYNASRQNSYPDDAFAHGDLVSLEHHENNLLRSFRNARFPVSAQSIDAAFADTESILKEFFAEAQKRPFAYFPPQTRPSQIRSLGASLSLHSITRLRLNDSLTDGIILILRIAEGFQISNKSLAATLVQFSFQPMFEGLAQHRWNEQQLFTLQNAYSRIDPSQLQRTDLHFVIHKSVESIDFDPSGPEPPIVRAFYYIAPRGWSDERKAKMLRLNYEYLPAMFDSQTRRVNLSKVLAAQSLTRDSVEREFLAHAENVIADLRQMLQIQTTLLQIQTACALERYRLKNNCYPAELSNLVPEYIAVVPEDPITGGSQIYRTDNPGVGITPWLDGSNTEATAYMLYGVGWDGQDNGGIPPDPYCIGPRVCRSDWVWFSDHKAAKKFLNETDPPPL
jgi:ABC-type transport system involved in multi-copper enzyme maturation permease subunit